MTKTTTALPQTYYKNYDIDTSKLSDQEKEYLKTLDQAVKLIGDIYVKQKNTEHPGGNFFPYDATREEVLQAAKSNPEILSPYTVVKRNKDKSLFPVPYHEEYKEEIQKIHDLVLKASDLQPDERYKAYLQRFSQDLLISDYDESEKLWLGLNGYKIDIRFGPIETYNDKLMGVKRAFQSNLRILNFEEQDNVGGYVKVIVELQPSVALSEIITEKHPIIRVDNIYSMSGWHADLIPRGSNYPDDVELAKHGVKVLIYDNSTREVNERFYKLAELVLNKDTYNNIQKERFLSNSTRYILFHEIAEAIVKLKYPDFQERLGAMNDIVREIYSDVIGVKSASIQVLKGVLSIEDYQDLLTIFILEALWQWYKAELKGRAVGTYADGFVLAVNYLLDNKAISIDKEGKIAIDFQTMYSAIDSLSSILITLISEGYETEAKNLFKEYDKKEIVKKYLKEVEKVA